MKCDVINVVEYVKDDLVGVTSFSNDEEGVKEAEAHFTKCAKDNGIYDIQDIDSFIEDGYFEQGEYQLFISSSL